MTSERIITQMIAYLLRTLIRVDRCFTILIELSPLIYCLAVETGLSGSIGFDGYKTVPCSELLLAVEAGSSGLICLDAFEAVLCTALLFAVETG